MSSKSLIAEIFNKSLRQESDISEEISKVLKGAYPIDTIDRIKEKIKEKIENFENSIGLLSDSLVDIQSEYEREIWLKKKGNLIISQKNLKKRLEESVYKIKKKNINSDSFYSNGDKGTFGKNINDLSQEKEVLNSILHMSNEIENNAMTVNSELDSQAFTLNGIKNKINGIYGKLVTSNTYTTFMIRRGHGDTMLCLVLGIITIAIIYYCYYYLRPKIKGA